MKTFKQFINENFQGVAKKLGVEIKVDKKFGKDTWHLADIKRKTKTKGTGAQVLHALHQEADKAHKKVYLRPVANKAGDSTKWYKSGPKKGQIVPTTGQKKLVKYYQKHGYKQSNKNDYHSDMERSPK
jgi:hypothetical protein